MYKKLLIGSAILATSVALSANVLDNLNAKVDALTEEIAQIKEKDSDTSSNDKLSFGGYGQADYTNYRDSGKASEIDLYRAVLYVGYQFTNDIKFVSEIEWEHGGSKDVNRAGGYVVMEQAYLDFKINNLVSIKVGQMLVPVGMVNLYHEPTYFETVNRPEVEKYIIPSTWSENGAILHGKINSFDYQVGLLAGLDAGLGNEVRGMRQGGQNSKADDFAIVARTDYKSNMGLNFGASIYSGEAGQGNANLSDVRTTIGDIHAGYNLNSFHINGLYALSKVSNANKVALENNSKSSGKSSGYYVTAAYDITNKWRPFIQYETYNRFNESFNNAGISTGAEDDIVNTTIGFNYRPSKNVVLKADYVMRDNQGIDDDRFRLGTGYVF